MPSTPKLPQPIIVPIAEGLYRVVDDYYYEWQIEHSDRRIGATTFTHQRLCVPTGFVSDGASVPRLLWTLTGLTPDGLIRAAALLHDYIYRHKGRLPAGAYQHFDKESGAWRDLDAVWSRRATDRLFARVMREAGVSKIKRRLAYLGVRVGGRFSW